MPAPSRCRWSTRHQLHARLLPSDAAQEAVAPPLRGVGAVAQYVIPGGPKLGLYLLAHSYFASVTGFHVFGAGLGFPMIPSATVRPPPPAPNAPPTRVPASKATAFQFPAEAFW